MESFFFMFDDPASVFLLDFISLLFWKPVFQNS